MPDNELVFAAPPDAEAIVRILNDPGNHTSDEVRIARRALIAKGESMTIRELKAFLYERKIYRFEIYNEGIPPIQYAAQTTVHGGKRAGFADIATALAAMYNYVTGVESAETMGRGGGLIQEVPNVSGT